MINNTIVHTGSNGESLRINKPFLFLLDAQRLYVKNQEERRQ